MTLLGRVTRNYLFGFSAYLVIFVTTRVSTIIIARYLGPEQNGIFQFLHGNAMLVCLLASAPFTYANIHSVSHFERLGRSGVAWDLLKLSLWITGLLGGTMAVAGVVHPEWLLAGFEHGERYARYLPWLVVVLPPMLMNYQLAAGVQGRQEWRWISLTSMVSLGGWMLGNFALWLAGAGLQAFLLMFAAQAYVALAMYLWFFRGDLRRGGERDWTLRREYLSRGLAMAPLALTELLVVQRSLENVLLERSVSPAELGFHANGYNTALTLMQIIPGVFWSVLFPVYAEQGALEDREKLQRLFTVGSRMLALMAMPVAAVAVALAEPGIILLYGADYRPAAAVFAITIGGTMVYSIKMGLSTFLVSTQRPRPVAIWNVAVSVIALGTLWRVTGQYGIMETALAKAGVLVLAAGGEMLILLLLAKVRYPFAEVFRIAAASTMAGAILGAGVRTVYLQPTFGMSLAVCLAGTALAPLLLALSFKLCGGLSTDDAEIFGRMLPRLPAPARGPAGWVLKTVARG